MVAGRLKERFNCPVCAIAPDQVDGFRIFIGANMALDEDLGQLLLRAGGVTLHVAGTLRPDRWQGREEAQLFIEDAVRA